MFRLNKVLKFAALLLCLVIGLFSLSSCGSNTVTSEVIYEEDGEDDDATDSDLTDSKKSNLSKKTKTSSNSDTKESSSKKKTSASSKKNNTTSNSGNADDGKSTFSYKPYVNTSASGKNTATVYRETAGFPSTNEYVVEVDAGGGKIKAPVYMAEVRRGGKLNKTYFASVDLTGSMTVYITPKKSYKTCVIYPESKKIAAESDGKTVSFKVSSEGSYTAIFDGEKISNLCLFVNPAETDLPDINDEDVIFFTPGIYDETNSDYIVKKDGIPVINVDRSGVTVYIAGGAIVNATILCGEKVRNVTVRGRGILNLLGRNDPNTGDRAANEQINGGNYPSGVKLVRNKNVVIEDIIIRNPCSFAIMGCELNGLTVDNVKIFTRCANGDGIDLCASSKITIKNSYIRTDDDCIAVYASRKSWHYLGNSSDWNVSDCVLFADAAHCVNIGTHGSDDSECPDSIYNIKFKNIDVIDCYAGTNKFWHGAFTISAGDENKVYDVTFENIRMSALSSSSPLTVASRLTPSTNTKAGKVENITFKNFTYYGKTYEASQIYGYDKTHTVKGVVFDGLTIGGTKIVSTNSSKYFSVGNFATEISFK